MKSFNNRDFSNKILSNFCLEHKDAAVVSPLNVDNRIYTVNKSIFDTDIYGNGDNALVIHDSSGDLLLFHYSYNQLKPPTADISIANTGGNPAYTIRGVLLDETDSTSVATVGYVDSVVSADTRIWQEDVLDVVAALPTAELNTGDRYLVIGSVETYENSIMEWDGDSWVESVPFVDWAVQSQSNYHLYAFMEINSVNQWKDFGGALTYSAGEGLNLSGTRFSFKRADPSDPDNITAQRGGLAVHPTEGAYVYHVAPFYINDAGQLDFNYSSDHFVVGKIGDETGILYPLQLATATAPLVATYNEDTHLTNFALSYENPIYINNGKASLKVYSLGGLYVDGTNGLILNIKTGGGILLDPSNGEAYIDPNLVGIEDIEDFRFTTRDDHVYALPSGFTNSATANFTLLYKVGTGPNAYYTPTEFEYRVYTTGANILNVLVPYDASMEGYSFRIIARA
jgi:hypothetical protein